MATTNVTPISDDVSSTPPPRRRRWLRRIVLVLVIVGGFFLVLLGITALATLGVRNDLAAGRKAMQEGRQAVAFGQLDAAADDFERASGHFADASKGADGGLASLAGAIPVLGRNLDVARGVAEAGTELADAGTQLVDAVRTLPDGLGSLAPQDGSLPIDAISSLGDEVVAAEDHARAALRRVRDTPSSLLAGPVADARFEAERQVEQAADAITALRLTLQGLPNFAGANGERTYFFVAESPAEQRGTGGIWGAYSIVTAKDGRFEFSKFAPIQQLPDLDPDTLPPPNPDYARNYDQYGGAGFWRNMNMTPDFPSASRAVLNAYETHTGERLDGVMSADPFALQELLAVTGPTTVPGLDRQIDADTVVPFTTNEAYIRFKESRERKEVLGDVAKGVFERFLGMEEHNIGRLRAVSSAVAGGHLKVYTDTDTSLQDALVLAGADGGLRASEPGDVSAVIVNSGSGSKVDYYANREVDYDVQLGGSGEAIATTEVRIRNDSPTSGVPGYVIKPLADGDPGDNIALVTMSCAPGCDLLTAERNGTPIDGLRYGSELGIPWYQDFFTIPAGTTGSLRMQTKLEDVWEGNSSAGTYRLTFLNQTTVQPTQVRIEIHAPAGQRITWTSTDMEIDGGTAVWEGTPGPRTDLEIRFAAPVPLRWWRDVVRPLGG